MDNNVPENNNTNVENFSSSSYGTKKKGNKIVLISVITLIVAALAAGGFFAYKMFMGKNPVKLTTKAVRGLKDSIADVKKDNDEIVKLLEGDGAYEIKSTINLDLPKELGDDYLINLLLQQDSEKNNMKLDLKAKEGSKSIADLSALIAASNVYFRFNDTMQNFYYTALEDTELSFDASQITNIPDIDTDKIIDYLADALESELSNKDFTKSKEELAIGGDEVKVNKYSAKLDEKKLKGILDSFLSKVEKDKDLLKALSTIFEAEESDIKDAIKEFKATKASDLGEVNFDYNVYVTSSGKVIGYGFTAEGVDLVFAYYDDVLSIQVIQSGVSVAFEVEKKNENHYIASVKALGMVIGQVEIKSKLETVEKGKEYKQSYDIKASVNTGNESLEGSLNIESTVKKISSVDTSAKTGAISIDSLSDAEAQVVMSQIEKSSAFRFIEGITSGMSLGEDVINYSY